MLFSDAKAALEWPHHQEYAFIIVSRHLDDMSGELCLHRLREKVTVGDALTIMTTSDDVTSLLVEANKAGFKLVFNKKDFISLQTFLTSVLNNRTLNLKGKILYIEDQKSVAASTVALFIKLSVRYSSRNKYKRCGKIFF